MSLHARVPEDENRETGEIIYEQEMAESHLEIMENIHLQSQSQDESHTWLAKEYHVCNSNTLKIEVLYLGRDKIHVFCTV